MTTSFPKKILMPLPHKGFDPSEAAVTWRILTEAGVSITFATPDGHPASADPIMVTGIGLGPFKYSMRADSRGREAYFLMGGSHEFKHPIKYEHIDREHFDGIVFSGGHAKEIIPYLENSVLQTITSSFHQEKRLVAGICHGVLILARSIDKNTNQSILYGKKVTSLPQWMETLAYTVTRLWMGTYYRTYPEITTQKEIENALQDKSDFILGPKKLKRDGPGHLKYGHVVQDGHIITARWPGDLHRFSQSILAQLKS
jgi:protease I